MTPALGAFLTIVGASVWFQAAGTGPAVVFLHAGIADSRMWDAEFDSLAATHRVVRLDLRGFGQSPHVSGTFSYHGDVVALLDSLKIDRATLVGCSFGSGIALDVAVAHPDRVERLVLVSPSIGDEAESAEIRAFGEREEAALAQGDVDAAIEENLRFWVDGPHRAPDQVDSDVRHLVGVMQRRAFAHAIPEGLSLDRLDPPARDRLSEIRVPTLIVAGALDVEHVLGVARRLNETIAGSRLEIVEGAAHMPTLEKPDAWREALRAFLKEEPAPASVPGHLSVRLEGGVSHRALRVKRTSQDYLDLTLPTGTHEFIPLYKVVRILDHTGRDRTKDVLDRFRTIDFGAPPEPKRTFFLRGKPPPERKRYAVMDIGLMRPLSKEKSGNDLKDFAVWQLAYLTNLGRRFALGPAVQIEMSEAEGRFGALLRARRWLSPNFSLEGAAGFSHGSSDDGLRAVRSTGPSFVVQGSGNVADLLLLTVQVETYTREYPYHVDRFTGTRLPGSTERGTLVSAGARGGAELGIVLFVVFGAFASWATWP